MILFDFDEATARSHLKSLYKIILDRTFGEDPEFDHAFRASREGILASLVYLGALDPQELRTLKMSEDEISEYIENAPFDALPELVDVLDVLLTFLSEFGTVPKPAKLERYAEFDFEVSPVLQSMGLLDHQCVPRPIFWPILINQRLLIPTDGIWDGRLIETIDHLCEMTLKGAPQVFGECLSGNSVHPATWGVGLLRRTWRYGQWLTEGQISRTLVQDYTELPCLVWKSLTSSRANVQSPAPS